MFCAAGLDCVGWHLHKLLHFMARAKSAPSDSSATIGFEAKLWLAADIRHSKFGIRNLAFDIFQFHHLAQRMAGFDLANGSISFNSGSFVQS